MKKVNIYKYRTTEELLAKREFYFNEISKIEEPELKWFNTNHFNNVELIKMNYIIQSEYIEQIKEFHNNFSNVLNSIIQIDNILILRLKDLN